LIYGGEDFSVGYQSSMKRVFKDKAFKGETVKNPIEISCAKNEYETFQLVILPKSRDLLGIKIEPEDFIGEDGKLKISKDNIKINIVGYVKIEKTFSGRKPGWYPDPLIPNFSVNVKSTEVQPFWVTIYVPTDTVAGKYKGRIKITPINMKSEEVLISLKVRDFSLPKTLHLKTMCWTPTETIKKFYKSVIPMEGKENVAKRDEIFRNYWGTLLEYRLGVGGDIALGMWWKIFGPVQGELGSLDFSEVERRLTWAFDRGLNAFIMGLTPNLKRENQKEYSQKYQEELKQYLREYSAFLEKKGWLDYAFVYTYDEAPKSAWPEVKKISNVIRSVNKKLKIYQCINEPEGVRELNDYVDIWDVYVAQYWGTGVSEYQKKGKEVWLAVCIWPADPPNLFVEYLPLDARVLSWFCWKYNAVGFEYWSSVSWKDNASSYKEYWKSVEFTDWKADDKGGQDGYLLYPGPDGTAIPSIRLSNLREGFEDYEYLYILREKFNANKSKLDSKISKEIQDLMVSEEIVTSTGSYSEDPKKIEELREKIGDLIEKLK